MANAISLIKANPLTPAEDFPLLRRKGIKQIEDLGHENWTEFNPSDPGITILEAVCYAITDLGYRSGFDVKDLLAPEKPGAESWRQIFYTARKILHNGPLTLNDYRRILIDIEGVRNAWIQPSKDYEVPVWVDYNVTRLNTHEDCSCPDHEMEECQGKLDVYPTSKEKVIAGKKEYIEELTKEIDERKEKMEALSGKEGREEEVARLKKEVEVLTAIRTRISNEVIAITAGTKQVMDAKIVEFEGLYNIMIEFEEDVAQNNDRKEEVRGQVLDRLLCHRNLCEDFLTIDTADYAEFGLGASVSLEEYADPDKVLAEIFFTIYKYFTPSVPFYSLSQLIAKGWQIDDIFEGPALEHGFIDETELEKTDLFRDIRLSDLINEISDISGLKAITYFHLPFTGFDHPDSGVNYFYQWVRQLRQERKIARIKPELSKVIFCKERETITYYTGKPDDRRPERMLKLFRDLKTWERKYKLELEENELDLPVPEGEYMETDDYYPVTYSLPMCYGVSDHEDLPSDATPKRKAQALQLKGYLLFFEQILSDFLVQLNHLRDLFSFDDQVKHTYYTRVLSELKDFRYLVIDSMDRGENNWEQIEDDFEKALSAIVETPFVFEDRRNRFLNHLLARFGEDLSEYENIMHWLMPESAAQKLIRDKTAILRNDEYYEISSNRAKAYDYSKQKVWDTRNVSGAERRVSRLLGFQDIRRRTLASESIEVEDYDPSAGEHHRHRAGGRHKKVIKVIDPANRERTLLTSVPVKRGCCTDTLISAILEHADKRKFFQFKSGPPEHGRRDGPRGPYSFELYDDVNMEEASLLAASAEFETERERDAAFDHLQRVMHEVNSNEGLHLVEHLLLRPRLDIVLDERGQNIDVELLDICLDSCDLGIGLNQPTEIPPYAKKVYRLPAKKCFDKMPWILEYLRWNRATKKYETSLLFQEVNKDNKNPVPLKFRRYEFLVARVKDLREFGAEWVNYEIVSNEETDPVKLKYAFIIYGRKKAVLAKSLYMFNKRTPAQVEANVQVADDVEEEILQLMRYFGFELDLYCQADPCDSNEDPYSFRVTVILPCWPRRLRNPTFRNLVEKTIDAEFPTHVHARVKWVGWLEMKRFELAYREWLEEMADTHMPDYPVNNHLVRVIDHLQSCGCCHDDCEDDNDHRPRSIINR